MVHCLRYRSDVLLPHTPLAITSLTPAFLMCSRAFTIVLYLVMAFGVASAMSPYDNPQTLLIEARTKASAGQTAEATALYRRAIALLPTDANVRIEFACLLARSGETRAEAERVYRQALTLAPRDASLIIKYATTLVSVGEAETAAAEYRRAFEIAPTSEIALQGYVRHISRLGAAPAAIRQHFEGLAATPNNLAARLLLAELLRSEGRYSDALDQFSVAQRRAPDNVIATQGVAESWLALGFFKQSEELFAHAAARSGRARGLAGQARALLAGGRPEAALRLLLVNSAEIEREPLALIALADIHRALDQPTNERATLERALALDAHGNTPAVLGRIARVAFETEDREASRVACERLLTLDPRNAIGTVGLEVIGGASPQIVTNAEESASPRRAGFDRERAEAALFWDQPALALPSLRRALEVWPDSPRLLFALGTALLETDAEGAAAAFSRITDRRNLRALLRQAQTASVLRNFTRALSIYRYVLGLDPSNFRALLGQAEMLGRTGDEQQAAALFADLVRRTPDSSAAYVGFRDVLVALGRSHRTRPSEFTLSPRANGSSNEQRASAITIELVEPVLETGDQLRIRVTGRPELNAQFQVDENGMVDVPLLSERIGARCLTERELSNRIAEQLRARLAGRVTVETQLTGFQRGSLTVSGAVYLPGSFQIRTTFDLRQSLMVAGGATPRAGRSIYVVRSPNPCVANQNPVTEQVEIYGRAAVEAGQSGLARPLGAGDIIVVPENDTAFIVGAVVRPSAITVRDGLTLSMVVQSLGGTQTNAQRSSVRLRRLSPDGGSLQQFSVNLDDIEQQRVGDVVLRPGDIVEIPFVSGETGRHSFAELLRRIVSTARPASTANLSRSN